MVLPPIIKRAASTSLLAIFKMSSDSKVQELQRDKKSQTSMRGRPNKWSGYRAISFQLVEELRWSYMINNYEGYHYSPPPPSEIQMKGKIHKKLLVHCTISPKGISKCVKKWVLGRPALRGTSNCCTGTSLFMFIDQVLNHLMLNLVIIEYLMVHPRNDIK